MKRIIFSLSLLLFMPGMYGQTGHITLEECQQKTQDNYPLVRQCGEGILASVCSFGKGVLSK